MKHCANVHSLIILNVVFPRIRVFFLTLSISIYRDEEEDDSFELFPFKDATLGPSKTTFRNQSPKKFSFSKVFDILKRLWKRTFLRLAPALDKLQRGYTYISKKIKLADNLQRFHNYLSIMIKPFTNRISKIFPQMQSME